MSPELWVMIVTPLAGTVIALVRGWAVWREGEALARDHDLRLFAARFREAQCQPHRMMYLGGGRVPSGVPLVVDEGDEYLPLADRHELVAPRALPAGRLSPVHLCCGAWPVHREHCTNRRQPVCTDGRWTVPGWDESTSDRVLAEYVAAELDRVDPL